VPCLHELFVDGRDGSGSEQRAAKLSAQLQLRWLERQCQPDTRVDDDNFASHVEEVLTERLQWEILAEEMPVVTMLDGRGRSRDRAPDPNKLRNLRAQPAETFPDPEQVKEFGQLGAETLLGSLDQHDLQRTTMRAGLVAWRAVQPSGKGGASVVRFGFEAILKPFLFIPVLLALTAPIGSLLAGAFTWLAVAVATERMVSPPVHLLILAGMAGTLFALAWRMHAKRITADVTPPGWPYYCVAAVLSLCLLAFPIVIRCVEWRMQFFGWVDLTEIRIPVAGVCGGLAVLAVLWRIVPGLWRRWLLAIAAGVVVAGLALVMLWWVGSNGSSRDWISFGILFAPLATIAVGLTYSFPPPPPDDAP
jgi:hypothetical protein